MSGLPPSFARPHVNHADVSPASETGVLVFPGTDIGPEPVGELLPGCCGEVVGAMVVEGVVVVIGDDVDGDDGDEDDGVEGDVGDVEEMSPGAAKANRFGDSVPASATRFGVADVMIVDITVEGEAVGVDDRNLAARPATWGDAIDVPVRV